MVKHTQANCGQQPTNCFSVFDQFMWFVLRGLMHCFLRKHLFAVIFQNSCLETILRNFPKKNSGVFLLEIVDIFLKKNLYFSKHSTITYTFKPMVNTK